MQIVTRRANESIVVDAAITVTVLEIGADAVTLEIVESDGHTNRVTIDCTCLEGETEIVDTLQEDLASC